MKTFKSTFAALVLAALPLSPALAAFDKNDPDFRACMDQLEENPEGAFTTARAMEKHASSDGALLCEARALVVLRAAKEGARKLDTLAAKTDFGDKNLRAEIYTEAANAWLAAGETEAARTSLDAATALAPSKVWIKTSLLIGQAQVDLAKFDYPAAESHLTAAIDILPNHLDALILRAGVRRQLQDPVGSLADLQYVLTEDPENPDALLERGLLKKDYFDPEGASVDLQKVIELAPGTAAAAKAKNTLNILNLREED